jgi:kynurenine formamidase
MARTRKPRVVDLTRRITHEMLNFPGEPRPGFIRFSGLDDLGFRCRQILMPTHFGTHTDAYSHFLPAGRTIDRMAPTQYMGPALVLDVRKRPDPTTVTRKDLEVACRRESERAASCSIPAGENGRRGLPTSRISPVSTPGRRGG